MSPETESRRPETLRAVPPRADLEAGYQPQASGRVDLRAVKPPKGDTAIVPPEKAAPQE